jgi:hypothetical protein
MIEKVSNGVLMMSEEVLSSSGLSIFGRAADGPHPGACRGAAACVATAGDASGTRQPHSMVETPKKLDDYLFVPFLLGKRGALARYESAG